VLALAACANPPHNLGQSGLRIDPSHDAPGEIGTATLRSDDLVRASDEAAEDIASRLDISDAQSPPVIFLGKVENHTSMPQQDWQVFLVRLRGLLAQSGTDSRHGLRFVRERDFVEQQRRREFGSEEGYASSADYELACEVHDLPSRGSQYYLLSFQLVQLREARSGPNLGPGAIVWEDQYEVKYQW
jgi:hypothetical protein